MKAQLAGMGCTGVSEQNNRNYFKSMYVSSPGGAMFELAWAEPEGWAKDEPADAIGSTWVSPPWFEHRRDQLMQGGGGDRVLSHGQPSLRHGVTIAKAGRSAWRCITSLRMFRGGSFNLPHAETHAILQPHTTAFNAVAVPDRLRPIADAFGAGAGSGLWDCATFIEAPTRLADLGMTETDLDRAAEISVRNPDANPRPFAQADIGRQLQDACDGRRPND